MALVRQRDVHARDVAVIERNPLKRWPVTLPAVDSPQVQLSQQLGFSVRLMQPGRVPLFAQPVGEKWWVEVYPQGQMPPNLPQRARLRWLRACGQGLVGATLVYHERPKQVQPRRLRWRRPLQLVNRFFEQTFRGWVEGVGNHFRLHEHSYGRVMLTGLTLASSLLAVAALVPVLTAASVVGVALQDPVLVIVTPSGQWVELDRWDD